MLITKNSNIVKTFISSLKGLKQFYSNTVLHLTNAVRTDNQLKTQSV